MKKYTSDETKRYHAAGHMAIQAFYRNGFVDMKKIVKEKGVSPFCDVKHFIQPAFANIIFLIFVLFEICKFIYFNKIIWAVELFLFPYFFVLSDVFGSMIGDKFGKRLTLKVQEDNIILEPDDKHLKLAVACLNKLIEETIAVEPNFNKYIEAVRTYNWMEFEFEGDLLELRFTRKDIINFLAK